jgi:hypothetical protein
VKLDLHGMDNFTFVTFEVLAAVNTRYSPRIYLYFPLLVRWLDRPYSHSGCSGDEEKNIQLSAGKWPLSSSP